MTGEYRPGDLPDQRDVLAETDWDVLCVLDALRYGHCTDMIDADADPVRSPASCTIRWVPEFVRAADVGDVVCVTANPEVTRRTHETVFHERDDLWQRQWEYRNGLGTVDPEHVVNAVTAQRAVLNPDRPVYAHFAQPHGPYPVHDPPLGVMRNNPYAGDVQTDNIDDDYQLGEQIVMDPLEYIDDPDHWLTVDLLRSAYRSNVEWVWDAIQPLLRSDATVVVTADHGEFLAEPVQYPHDGEVVENRVYGHPPGVDHPLLRTVPWLVYR